MDEFMFPQSESLLNTDAEHRPRSSNVDYPVMDSGGRQMLYIGQAGKSKSYGLPCLWPVR